MPKPTIASLTARVAELEAQLAALSGTGVAALPTKSGPTRYDISGIKVKSMSYTPSAVDAIRLYVWPRKATVSQKDLINELIFQGFNKATVRARVKRIFDGTDESCYSEDIRLRLGLDDDAEDQDNEDEDEGEE